MKKNFLLILIILIPMMIFANSQDEQIMILKKTFYRGNLQDKIQVITLENESNKYTLIKIYSKNQLIP